MNYMIKKAILAVALSTAASSAFAFQQDITVTANVDPTLALLQSNGQPVSDMAELGYIPGVGLSSWSQEVVIASNDITKDVNVRLQTAAMLSAAMNPSITEPLTVSLGGKVLTDSDTEFKADELYAGGGANNSVAMDLKIGQTTTKELATAGIYTGVVRVILAAAP